MITPFVVPGMGTGTLLIGGIVFAIVLVAILGAVFIYANPWESEPWEEFAEATRAIVEEENADAIALIPYSDGPIVPKPAIYDRELMGGKGGYRTADDERIYVDGEGNGKFTMEGVDVILAIDPTEHAAAADPLKSYIAHEMDVGRWIKVDRKENIIQAGEALANLDGVTPAMDKGMPGANAVADGGYPSEVHRKADKEGMSLDDALSELELAGMVQKIVDLAPPREAVVDEETGEVNVESADHVGVDVSAAANLLPKKTNTTSLQVMEEKAKQEGRDEDKLMEYMMYGIAVGAAVAGISSVLIALVLGFT